MTAIVKEEMAMETNYLQMYQEHISGYKQYKNEKNPRASRTAEPLEINEVPVTEVLYYSTDKSSIPD